MASYGSPLEAELTSHLSALSCSVPRQWLREFIAQHPLATGDDCFQAILNSDLSRVGLFSLPNNLFPIKARGVLKGNSLVQVVSVLDVGASSYSQLCHLEGTVNNNNEVSAEEPTNERETTVRGRRCLLLELSDGRCPIRAVEFEPIDCLSADMRRGSKLLLRGPLEVRRSVIFLRSGSVEFLGGTCPNEVSIEEGSEQDPDAIQMQIRKRELEEALQQHRVR